MRRIFISHCCILQVPDSDNYSAIIVRANKDGLLWANSINLTSEPGKLAYNVSTDEIIINYNVEDIEGVGGALVGNKVTISSNGGIVE